MLNLGQLNFVLGVDTSRLDAAKRAVEAFGRATSASQANANRGLDSNVAQYRKIENAIMAAGEKLNTFVAKVKSADLAPNVRTDMIKAAEKAYSDLSLKIADTQRLGDNTNLDRGVGKFANTINDLSRGLGTAQQEFRELSKAASQLDGAKALEAQNAALAKFDQHLRSQGISWNQNDAAIKSARSSMEVFVAAEKSAVADAKALADAQRTVARETAASERASLSQARALSGALEKGKNLANSITNSGLSEGSQIGLTDKIQAQVNKLKTALSGPEPLKPREFQAAQLTYTEGLGKIRREFANLRKAELGQAMDPEAWRKMKSALQSAGSTMLFVNGHLGGMSTRMLALGTLVKELNIGMAAATAGVAAFGMAIVGLVSGTLRVALELEKAEKALKAVTGTMAAARVEMDFLKQVANDTGNVYTELTRGYAKFAAASVTAGQTMAQTQQQFRDMAFITGNLGLSVEDAQGVFRAFEQILSKGQLQAEELRGQLGDRLPGAFAIAARSMGVTTKQLSEMTKKGEIASREFIPKFIEGLKEAYNINVDEPVDTLQAALNRATNAVTNFFDAIRRNTTVVDATKKIVNAFADAVQWLADNMVQIIRITAQVAGVIGGAAAAWAAWYAVILAGAVLTKTMAWLGALIGLLRTARTVTEMMTVAQLALNAAMAANPYTAIIGLIVKLGVVLGGAIFGYKQMTAWVNNTAAAMDGSLKEMEDYIAQQKEMGFQISTTTKELIKQAQAMAIAHNVAMEAKKEELRAARTGGPSFGDAVGSFANFRLGRRVSPNDMRLGRLKVLTEEANEMAAAGQRIANALRGLGDVSGLQDIGDFYGALQEGASGAEDASKKANKAVEDNIDSVLGLIRAVALLSEKQKVLNQGPSALESLDYIAEARDMIRDFSQKELSMAADALEKAGFKGETLEESLAQLVGTVDKGEKSLEAFVSIWNDMDDAGKTLDDLQEKMNLIMGGGSERDLKFVDHMREAQEMVKDLSGPETDALIMKLADMGFGLAAGEDPARALAAALAFLFQTITDGEVALDTMKSFYDEIAKIKGETDEFMVTLEGLQMGLTGRQLDMWVENELALNKWGQTLLAQGKSVEEVTKLLNEMRAAMQTREMVAEATDAAKRAADFKEDIAQAVADFAGDVVEDFTKIWDAAKTLFKRIQQLIIETFIVEPLMNTIKGALQSIRLPTWGFANGGLVKAASGGYIRGPGTSTSDSIPARLSDGEFVFKAAAVRRWGVSTLEAMNSGRVPAEGFARGGVVGRRNTEPTRAGDTIVKVYTPNADSFTRSRRQIRRAAKKGFN